MLLVATECYEPWYSPYPGFQVSLNGGYVARTLKRIQVPNIQYLAFGQCSHTAGFGYVYDKLNRWNQGYLRCLYCFGSVEHTWAVQVRFGVQG